ncbi:Zinc finger CCCH domain-containing protein 5 [Platanthera zijinensis]|uniref:Zinc finger CCCH domain-containing protein 5 n=1 Tax=Platanthera zijinensis TaxID=2320716 RepID=A0AAP0GC13_9ASPA
MANPVNGEGPKEPTNAADSGNQSRKEKRKALKKLKRRQIRTEAAIKEREEEDALLNAPEEQLLLRVREQEEAEQAERNRREFEERERVWLEEVAARKAREEEDARRKKLLEEEERKAKIEHAYGLEADDEYDYDEDGPPEIIWQGNEIIIKKKRVKVAKRITEPVQDKKDDDRPTSNPLPPQSAIFASCTQGEPATVQEMLDSVAQQVPNFGTEQDKAHCPFHLKTGACRFGSRCSRVHFYPDKSCTLLVKNMYNGPGLTCEQDEGLEFTDEEVERCYDEFYDDVHTEFLKFGEIVNFKVCKNSSYHLRGNVYVHYKSLESAIIAYNTMNARYYAGKQIVCEFAGVTKWKVAICGEFMKSRLKTCSHGSACNFIHCFRNPGGDYEWADWDNPPPRYWVKKMVVLFGTSAESSYDKELESDDYNRHREPERMRTSRGYSAFIPSGCPSRLPLPQIAKPVISIVSPTPIRDFCSPPLPIRTPQAAASIARRSPSSSLEDFPPLPRCTRSQSRARNMLVSKGNLLPTSDNLDSVFPASTEAASFCPEPLTAAQHRPDALEVRPAPVKPPQHQPMTDLPDLSPPTPLGRFAQPDSSLTSSGQPTSPRPAPLPAALRQPYSAILIEQRLLLSSSINGGPLLAASTGLLPPLTPFPPFPPVSLTHHLRLTQWPTSIPSCKFLSPSPSSSQITTTLLLLPSPPNYWQTDRPNRPRVPPVKRRFHQPCQNFVPRGMTATGCHDTCGWIIQFLTATKTP